MNNKTRKHEQQQSSPSNTSSLVESESPFGAVTIVFGHEPHLVHDIFVSSNGYYEILSVFDNNALNEKMENMAYKTDGYGSYNTAGDTKQDGYHS